MNEASRAGDRDPSGSQNPACPNQFSSVQFSWLLEMPGNRAEIPDQTAESSWVNLPPRGKARRRTERAGTALSEDKNSFEPHSHQSRTDSRKLVRNGPENLLLGPRGPSGRGGVGQVSGPGRSQRWIPRMETGPPTIILKCCGLQSRPQERKTAGGGKNLIFGHFPIGNYKGKPPEAENF